MKIMVWKEFFVPDLKKIILTIILLVFSYFLFMSVFIERFIGMCIVCIQCPCYPDQVEGDWMQPLSTSLKPLGAGLR